MPGTRTEALMQQAGRAALRRRHDAPHPGQANLAMQAMYGGLRRNPVYRPGPAWHGPRCASGEDPARMLMTPPDTPRRRERLLRAAFVLTTSFLLSPIAPALLG